MGSTSHNQTPSSSSVSTSSSTTYDVFLSFRGPDTRHTFTDHLFNGLDAVNVLTFRDTEELPSGERISDALPEAIYNSKTYVVVLSENYADSHWCLDELVEILNCCKTMQRLVIPVFYYIQPSDLRHHGAGKFAEAFKKHEKCFGGERLAKWCETLKEVGDISGYTVRRDKSEASIVNEIIDRIFFYTNPEALHIANYPVGLKSRVEKITSMFSCSKTKGLHTRIGIYGMGGVGKTTLAKAVYNETYRDFQGSCFLKNVREKSATEEGILCLQKQLIHNVLKRKDIVVNSVDHGIVVIKDRICSSKLLIVIDDLDDLRMLKCLEGPFTLGSVVIITTRNEDMLDSVPVEARYKVNELGYAEARQLFSGHAFRDGQISHTLNTLCEEIIECAGGLPWALEVFGSMLISKDEEGWICITDKIKRVSVIEVMKTLMISFNGLQSDCQRNIFLDIACFFIGREEKEVVKILETYYTSVAYNIGVLKKRSLLSINIRDNLMVMHYQLRDMGRDIARNDSPRQPENHSRLWVSKDIYNVLKKKKGTIAIEGIIPAIDGIMPAIEVVSLVTETFTRMNNLRFLSLDNVTLTGNFEHILEDLRWLYWYRCPLKFFPPTFNPERLLVLELPHSKLRTTWELNVTGFVRPVFPNLKTLNMSYSLDLITIPGLNNVPCLETLNLEGCKNLEAVHISIGSLTNLVSLNLCGCVKLSTLPDTIRNLRALEILSIANCIGLKALPKELGIKEIQLVTRLRDCSGYKEIQLLNELTSLRKLHVGGCNSTLLANISTERFFKLGNIDSLTELNAEGPSVSTLPDSTGHLTKLVELNLSNNKKLKTLPDTICNLRSLEILDIDCCSNLKALPLAIGNLVSLKKINGMELTVLNLPDSIGSLTKLVELDLRDNKNLETLPDTLCNLISLEILDIGSCSSLEALPTDIGNIESLKKIDVWGLNVFKLPDSIGHLANLDHLDLSYNKKLEILPDAICNLRSLEILSIRACEKLEILPDRLWEITRLRELDAYGATGLKKLPEIGSSKIASSLQILDLSGSGITALPSGFSQLSNLQSLDITWCYHLLSIPELPHNLKCIRAISCGSLERLQNLSNLKQLETLELAGCWSLTEILGLEELTALIDLDLICCSGLTEIQGLEQLTSIRILRLEDRGDSLHLLTKRLFQIYSKFDHEVGVFYLNPILSPKFHLGESRPVAKVEIRVYENSKVGHKWPDWMIKSPYWTSSRKSQSQMYAHLLPNESQNFMGIILCFSHPEDWRSSRFGYSVKNITSGFIWRSNTLHVPDIYELLMVIVPESIFSVTDDDHTIELTADSSVEIAGIHLLYNTQTDILEDVKEKHVIDIDALKLVDPDLQDILLDSA